MKETDEAAIEIKNMIASYCRQNGITQRQLSAYIWGSQTALSKRLKDPERIRVNELALIQKRLNMNEEARTKMNEILFRKVAW